jgi:hypothetical protein
MAPSSIVWSGLGTINSGSSSIRVPSPSHSEHAPCGLLKENVRGSISGRLIPHTGQARCSEYSVSSAGSAEISLTITTPSPNRSAVSTESARREAKEE